jgi:N-acetyl-anhydromuramyl-L-alanine amidase AmpD
VRPFVVALLTVSSVGLTDAGVRFDRPELAAVAEVAPLRGSMELPGGPIPEPTPAARASSLSRSATIRFPFVPQAEWAPTQTNYWEGRDGAAVEYIVIHYTEISYARTLRAFNIRSSDVSAHYVVRGDGHIAQIVGEADTAWHAGNVWFNRHSIGIELELNERTNPVFTAEQYYAAASLACAISGRHGVPLDRAHVVGHNEIPGTDHTDPGPTWGWPHFMWLTSLCAPPTPSTVRASFVSTTPYPDIPANETGTVSIVLRNDGRTAWRKGTTQEARLGIPNNSRELSILGDGWLAPERPAVQLEEIVPPGGTATFTFGVKGMLQGTYVLRLQGVIDGAAWMDDLGLYTVITVR